jgi:hypothetical protein
VKRILCIAAVFLATSLAGVICAELTYHSISCRNAFGLLFGRGRLLALVHGAGIYEADVERAMQEAASRGAVNEMDGSGSKIDRGAILSELVANARLEDLARQTAVSRLTIDHEYDLLRYQLRPEQKWLGALRRNGFFSRPLHSQLARGLRGLRWIEQQIARQIETSPDERLHYYGTHLDAYLQPVRFRASHLFLAAPAGTAAEVVEAKHSLMETFSKSIAQGAKFADIVSSSSEDEATKTRGGDLNYFSETRTPSDFYAPVTKLRVGEFSPIIRTRLGFHIVQLTDNQPAGGMTFERSQSEIRLAVENLKRRAATTALKAKLGREADFVVGPPL